MTYLQTLVINCHTLAFVVLYVNSTEQSAVFSTEVKYIVIRCLPTSTAIYSSVRKLSPSMKDLVQSKLLITLCINPCYYENDSCQAVC